MRTLLECESNAAVTPDCPSPSPSVLLLVISVMVLISGLGCHAKESRSLSQLLLTEYSTRSARMTAHARTNPRFIDGKTYLSTAPTRMFAMHSETRKSGYPPEMLHHENEIGAPVSFASTANAGARPNVPDVGDTVWARRLALDSSIPMKIPASITPTALRGPLPGFRQTLIRDIEESPKRLWNETKNVYTDPGNLIVLLGATGASLALHQDVDDRNAAFFRDENHFGQGWRDALSFAGSPATHFALAGVWYSVGIWKQDDKTYEVGKTLIDALVINGLSTLLLKAAVNNNSPNGEDLAFPSGHVSSSVAFATVMHESYGPWVGIPLYGISALVGMERLDDGEHWMSDVVFGAALGWVVGHSVAKGRRPEIFGGEIAPYVNPDNQTAGLVWIKAI